MKSEAYMYITDEFAVKHKISFKSYIARNSNDVKSEYNVKMVL